MNTRITRRTFLTTTAASAAIAGFPLPLRAQASTFRIGAVHPVTGPLAEPGQAAGVDDDALGSNIGLRAILLDADRAGAGDRAPAVDRVDLVLLDLVPSLHFVQELSEVVNLWR